MYAHKNKSFMKKKKIRNNRLVCNVHKYNFCVLHHTYLAYLSTSTQPPSLNLKYKYTYDDCIFCISLSVQIFATIRPPPSKVE